MPRRRGEFASSEIAKATAQSPLRPASSIAWRASRTPSRATSSHWARPLAPGPLRTSSSVAERIDHVSVEMTSQPAATYARCTSSTACGARYSAQVPHSSGSGSACRCSSVATPPSRMTQRSDAISSSRRAYAPERTSGPPGLVGCGIGGSMRSATGSRTEPPPR